MRKKSEGPVRAPSGPYDVVVIGSGAAGLVAATTAAKAGLSVLVCEKTYFFGGTTAFSGGGVWVPATAAMASSGLKDTISDAETYLRAVMGDAYDHAHINKYLENAGPTLEFLAAAADLRLFSSGGPDYEPHQAGAAFGRCHLTPEFDGRLLGPWLRFLRPALPQMGAPLGMQVAFADIGPFTQAHRSISALRYTLGKAVRHAWDLLLHGRATRLTNGNALAGALLKGAVDAGVELVNNAQVTGVLPGADGVAGVLLRIKDGELRIEARHGVLLATGGFGQDKLLYATHIPLHDTAPCLQAEGSTGDGLRLAQELGATLARDNIADGIWAPMSTLTGRKSFRPIHYPHLMGDRLMPGTLIIDETGARFTNEANHYQGFGTAIEQRRPRAMFLIADCRALRRYGLGLAKPAPWPNRRVRRAGYLVEAPSIGALAIKLGVDRERLEGAVTRFNASARDGIDPDFGRGTSKYAQVMGDPAHKPNPSLGPVEQAPFYAVRLTPGTLATTLGLITDPEARVLDEHGRPISRLYAVGVDMNSIWKGHYPGGGASLGPAMVFGHIAARTIAESQDRSANLEGPRSVG